MPPYYKQNDQALRSWVDNFQSVCNTNQLVLGLDIAEMAEITNAKTAWATSLDAAATAKAAAVGSTATKENQKVATLTTVSKFANQFQSIPGLSPQLIAQLGLVVHGSGPSPIPVFPPAQLSAFGQSNGVNALRWKANGNSGGTTYVIEAAYDGTAVWEYVESVSRTRFEHPGQTPGRPVVYRVTAKRADRTSAPSNEASVYANGGQQVMLKAA